VTPFILPLWGFVKDNIHIPPLPITLNNLKDQIVRTVAKIDQLVCRIFGTKPNIVLKWQGIRWGMY
jgi:hypothetical protein